MYGEATGTITKSYDGYPKSKVDYIMSNKPDPNNIITVFNPTKKGLQLQNVIADRKSVCKETEVIQKLQDTAMHVAISFSFSGKA